MKNDKKVGGFRGLGGRIVILEQYAKRIVITTIPNLNSLAQSVKKLSNREKRTQNRGFLGVLGGF